MKERGIILNTAMINAVIEGRKTQLRHVLPKHQIPKINAETKKEPSCKWVSVAQIHDRYGFIVSGKSEIECINELVSYAPCPLGNKGDLLWVRETFCNGRIDEYDAEHPLDRYLYVDQSSEGIVYKESCIYEGVNIDDVAWKPSSQMKRSQSRLLLEITNVRIERLQSISEEDAMAEGFNGVDNTYTSNFAIDWIQRNGEESWLSNPWIWVIEFKKVE